jgi:anti-sigma factor RsiW
MEHEKIVQNLAVECYLLGEMAPKEREAFEEHYFECSLCAEDVRAASQFLEDAKDILAAGREYPAYQPEREPEPVRTRWNWLAWLQPQFAGAAIAVLLVVAGVQNFGTIPGLRKQLSEADVPRALPTTVLLAQTRSSMPTLKAGPGGSLSLQIDVPETTASSLQFIVQSTAGQEVLHSSGDVPAPGKSVNFFIPKLDAPDGTYTLVVKTGDSSGLKLAEYPFRLEHR